MLSAASNRRELIDGNCLEEAVSETTFQLFRKDEEALC